MAHVTRISAGKSGKKDETPKPKAMKPSKAIKTIKKMDASIKAEQNKKHTAPNSRVTARAEAGKALSKAKTKEAKRAERAAKRAEKKKNEKPFVTAIKMPFRATGRYFSESWHEIRTCRWPSRKATWGMVLAVFIYTAIFMIFITLLDMLFKFIFNTILG
ncbi:MAG: preprotein translocase subunit SecE [Candidatus Saccharibacteria bacterium]|nr:preprotein translocase subunit SecE [Candidatus Saccharibacteria bacterium]